MRSKIRLAPLLFPVFRASLRTWWLYRRLPLDEACNALAQGRRLPRPLRDPDGYSRVVNRLIRWLPPYNLGPCIKRSLLLLDLWSRCGLEPRFHLGVRTKDEQRDGHAWVTVDGRPDLSAGEEDYAEAFVWDG